MMKALATPETPETIQWSKRYNELSQQAKLLYTSIYDYCTYSSDPQYNTLHKFRNQIDRLANTGDREVLIHYFNQDPAIVFNGMPCEPFEYYKDPY